MRLALLALLLLPSAGALSVLEGPTRDGADVVLTIRAGTLAAASRDGALLVLPDGVIALPPESGPVDLARLARHSVNGVEGYVVRLRGTGPVLLTEAGAGVAVRLGDPSGAPPAPGEPPAEGAAARPSREPAALQPQAPDWFSRFSTDGEVELAGAEAAASGSVWIGLGAALAIGVGLVWWKRR